MRTINFIKNPYIKSSFFILAGLLLGWLFFSKNGTTSASSPSVDSTAQTTKQIWTCSMHPQIKMDHPGLCPICGMELIPLVNQASTIDENAIEMSEAAMKLAEVQTTIVQKGKLIKEVFLYGKIQYDETSLQSQTAHIPGRIEKLYVNFTGEVVRKGQILAEVYSPELVNAQKELLEAKSLGEKYPVVLKASREKLYNWKLTDEQIADIENSGKVSTSFPIFANTNGVVLAKKVNYGDYISAGGVLFEIADLSKVWAVFDAYESDLPWIALGQKMEFTSQSVPDKIFHGNISFIDPVIDPVKRIAKVRIEMANPNNILKPESFVNGKISAVLASKANQLVVPKSAVLWTGKRSIVYVKNPSKEQATFAMREITLGASLKDFYVVVDGLTSGEEIVTNGVFSVDAATQLAGKPSMINSNTQHSSQPTPTPHQEQEHKPITNKEKMQHASFTVSGNCEMCKDRIETAVKKIDGIQSVDWNIKTKKIHLTFSKEKTNIDKIHQVIAQQGHDTELVKATQEQYNQLPECCQYRNP